MLNCIYCGKSNSRIWRKEKHENSCKLNPKNKDVFIFKGQSFSNSKLQQGYNRQLLTGLFSERFGKLIITKRICKKCNSEFEIINNEKFDINGKQFCSDKCSNSRIFNNLNKKELKKIKKTYSIQIKKILNKVKIKKCYYKKKFFICKECGIEFSKMVTGNGKILYCSKECFSNSMIKRVIEKGTNNLSTRINIEFNGQQYNLDSKLEVAAIYYLFNLLKFNSIKRFNGILNYKNKNNVTKKFNPDFIGIKDNKVYIIEVKMIWKNKVDNRYSEDIEYKKNKLIEFCKNKGYEMIWLDFNYDKKFRKVYKKIIKEKQNKGNLDKFNIKIIDV